MSSTVRATLTKVCEFLLTTLLVSFFTFAAFSIIPGDPARIMLGTEASEEQVEQLRVELGLNEPLAERYVKWLGNAFRGDFGTSLSFNTSVGDLISSRLPVTLGMSLIALIIVLLVSFPMAAICSKRPGKPLDKTLSCAGHILFAIPPFALSMMLILFSATVLGMTLHGALSELRLLHLEPASALVLHSAPEDRDDIQVPSRLYDRVLSGGLRKNSEKPRPHGPSHYAEAHHPELHGIFGNGHIPGTLGHHGRFAHSRAGI